MLVLFCYSDGSYTAARFPPEFWNRQTPSDKRRMALSHSWKAYATWFEDVEEGHTLEFPSIKLFELFEVY